MLRVALLCALALASCDRGVRVVGQGRCGQVPCDAGAPADPLPIAWDASFEKPGAQSELDTLAAELAGTWWGVVRQTTSEDVPVRTIYFELSFTPGEDSARTGRFGVRCISQPDCDALLVALVFGLPGNSGRYELYFVNEQGEARGAFSGTSGPASWSISFHALHIETIGDRTLLKFSLDAASASGSSLLGEAVLVRGAAPDGGLALPSVPDAGEDAAVSGARDAAVSDRDAAMPTADGGP